MIQGFYILNFIIHQSGYGRDSWERFDKLQIHTNPLLWSFIDWLMSYLLERVASVASNFFQKFLANTLWELYMTFLSMIWVRVYIYEPGTSSKTWGRSCPELLTFGNVIVLESTLSLKFLEQLVQKLLCVQSDLLCNQLHYPEEDEWCLFYQLWNSVRFY